MLKTSLELPQPDAQDRTRSKHLLEFLKEHAEVGHMSFAAFMQACLYTPELGYYAGPSTIFGEEGDFVTSPELTPIFSQTLANQLAEVIGNVDNADVLEFGGGSGSMAANVLLTLDSMESLPQHYYIVEISKQLRHRQRDTLKRLAPRLLPRVQWLECPPKDFRGVMMANEVLDALPVHRLKKTKSAIVECNVSLQDEEPAWRDVKLADETLRAFMQKYYHDVIETLPTDYYFELCVGMQSWLKQVAECLEEGVVILIDYGYPRHELFHPQRYQGTLACHYRHRTHPNPLVLVGLQDITAHVDFTLVAEIAVENGLQVRGFNHQAGFLLGCGLEQYLNPHAQDAQSLNDIAKAKKLLLPSDMGETFKVMGLVKNYDEPLRGFAFFDQRDRL